MSYECYLISEVEEALPARHRALDLFQLLDERAAVGATERWLSRLSWLLGRGDDGRRYALRAVATLEPLGDGHELAMAYSNMAQLSMLAGEITETVDWGERALASARRIGDREVEIHALNNIGSVLTSSDDVRRDVTTSPRVSISRWRRTRMSTSAARTPISATTV